MEYQLVNFTNALLEEKYVTISAIQPLLSHIMNSLLASTEQECAMATQMKNKIAMT